MSTTTTDSKPLYRCQVCGYTTSEPRYRSQFLDPFRCFDVTCDGPVVLVARPRPTPETDAEFPSLRHHPDETAVWVSIGRLRDLERQRDEARSERDQLSRDLSSLLAGDCLDGHDAVEGARNGIAMRNRLRALEWKPTAESLPTEDDANDTHDVEWADQHDIWQGNYQDHELATHWRPITLPNPQ